MRAKKVTFEVLIVLSLFVSRGGCAGTGGEVRREGRRGRCWRREGGKGDTQEKEIKRHIDINKNKNIYTDTQNTAFSHTEIKNTDTHTD